MTAPARDDLDRVISAVERFRLDAGLTTIPVDLAAAYAFRGLQPPSHLYGDEFDQYLTFHQAKALDTSFRRGMRACIDPWTLEVQLDFSLPEPRLRMAAAHELMHDYFDHCAIVRLNSPLMLRRGEIEWEARTGAVELLAPQGPFRAMLFDLAPTGKRAGLEEVKVVADHFKISRYTAIRRHAELSAFPTALVSVRIPNYDGDGVPRHMRVEGYRSRTWDHSAGPSAFLRAHLDIETDPLARLSYQALKNRGDDKTIHEIRHHAEARYGGSAELLVTGTSVHILLSASSV
jgi:hypothetical protein